MWYLVALLTASQLAVSVPSARVRLTLDGVAGGDWASAGGGGGGEYERGEREGQERGKPPRQTRERKRL